MKIKIKGITEDYYLKALQQIQIFYTQVCKEDKVAQLAPWKDNSDQPTILTPKIFPVKKNKLRITSTD